MKNKEPHTGSLRINGIGVSQGISIGKARVLKKEAAVLSGVVVKEQAAILAEIEKFDTAVQASVDEIVALKQKLETGNGDEAGILETQIELLTDPQIKADVVAKITMTGRNANDALIEVTKEIVALFKNMDDEYMRARSADMEDISNRILKNLNQSATAIEQFESDTILIADDITPSDTITMDVKHILGFATRTGGKTSHTAILARAKGIPAVVGCGDQLQLITDNDIIIVDGNNGSIIINPADDILNEYKIKKDEHSEKTALLRSLKNVPAKTLDGETIHLSANISNADDIEAAFEYGAEGSGLFRTELLFMGRDSFPSEEEQFEFYKQVALKSRQKPVIVRTIDIGGDKQLSYFGLPDEENPSLGYRAIRICLDRKDIFLSHN